MAWPIASFCDLIRGGWSGGRPVCGVYLQVSYVCQGTAAASRHLLLGCDALTFSRVSMKRAASVHAASFTPKKLES